MSQQLTTIQSGNTPVRGYSKDGVFIAAAALPEYIVWLITARGSSSSISVIVNLRNEFPMELIASYGNHSDSEGFSFTFMTSNDVVVADTINGNPGTAKLRNYIGVIFPENAKLLIESSVIDSVDVTITAKRVAVLPGSFEVYAGT